MRGVWASLAPLVDCEEQGEGLETETKWGKKGGGWEGKKNSIFVKRGKRPRGEFLLGILELEKKKHKKRQKKENILTGYVYQLGQRREAGLRGWGTMGPHRDTHAPQEHTAALTDPKTRPRHV